MDQRPSLLSDLFRMSAKLVVGGLIVVVLLFFGTAAIIGGIASGIAGAGGDATAQKDGYVTLEGDDDTAEKSILRLRLEGPIMGHPPKNRSSFFFSDSSTYGYELKEDLDKAAKSEDVDGVLLYVSTPGGTIHGSHAIHEGIQAVKAAGKPVIVYVDTISVSGGAWSTAAADAIFADRGSFHAMVGVLGPQLLEFVDPVGLDVFLGTGVETRGGVKFNWIHSGKGKDFGNPFRPAEQWELDLWQTNLDQSYDMFVDHMVTHRGIDRRILTETLGAGIVSNAQAEQYGFINGTKTYDEVVDYVAEQLETETDKLKIMGPRKDHTSPFGGRLSETLARFLPMADTAGPKNTLCTELLSQPLVMWPVHLQNMCGK